MQELIATELNDEQREAVNFEGSVFLTACPGSGKTKTLTYRIAKELSEVRSHREFVVAITYTHRAADEIVERIERLGVNTDQLWIGTIHSFCLEWIVRPYFMYEDRLKSGFTIINQPDAEDLINEICKKLPSPKIDSFDCGYYFKDGRVCLQSNDSWKFDNINLALKEYFRVLKAGRKIDFELILFFARKLISNYPEIARRLSGLFNIILVDEFQDTRRIQYEIICAIFRAGKTKTKAFFVGDPNQAIFKSLGGYPIAFEEFVEISSLKVKAFSLTKNYRSSKKIVDYFNNFRVNDVEVAPFSKDKEYPSSVVYDKDVLLEDLENRIVDFLNYSLYTLDIPPEEICIVGPQWASLAKITRNLMARMPHLSFDGPGMIPFGRELDNFWYKLSRIALSEPAPDMYVRRIRWAKEVLNELGDQGYRKDITPKILLRELNKISIDETDGMAYLKRYFELFQDLFGVNFQESNSLKNHYDSFFESARKKIDRAKRGGNDLIEGIDNFRRAFRPKTGVTISTIHGVKGGEFDNVIAFALLEGMVPNNKDPEPTDSAKRLLYVISSRARKNLFLISEIGRKRVPTEALSAIKYDYTKLAL